LVPYFILVCTFHLLSYANFTTSCVATLCFVYKHSLSIYVNICVKSVCSSVANFDAVPLFDAYWHTVAVYLVHAVVLHFGVVGMLSF
jgi:hypothetical protein